MLYWTSYDKWNFNGIFQQSNILEILKKSSSFVIFAFIVYIV